MNKPTREILSDNLRYLMRKKDWNQTEMAKRSQVSQRTISNILNNEKVPTLDTVDLIASTFHLSGYSLLSSCMIDDIETDARLEEITQLFMDSDQEGREHIRFVANREAKISKNA